MTKIKDDERILKAAGEKQRGTLQGRLHKAISYFSAELGRHYIFKLLKGKNLQAGILHTTPVKGIVQN